MVSDTVRRNLATSALTAQVDAAQAAWQAQQHRTRQRRLMLHTTVLAVTAVALAVMAAAAGICYVYGAWWWALGLFLPCVAMIGLLGMGGQR